MLSRSAKGVEPRLAYYLSCDRNVVVVAVYTAQANYKPIK